MRIQGCLNANDGIKNSDYQPKVENEEKLKSSCKRLPRRQMNEEKNFSTRQQASTRTDAERLEEEAEGRLQSNPSMTRS